MNGINLVYDNIKDTYIAKSSIHGYGLFADKAFAEHSFLCALDGQKIEWSFYLKLRESLNVSESFIEWNALSEDILLLRLLRTKYSFINHSRAPNLILQVDKSSSTVSVYTLKNIKKDDELFLDYRNEPVNKQWIFEHGRYFL